MTSSARRLLTPTNALRALVAATLLPMLLLPRASLEHFQGHLSGAILDRMVTGDWGLVALNAAAFTAFLVPLSFRRRVDWRERGLVAAFFVSLFVEMYGVPLLIALVAPSLEPLAPGDMGTVAHVDVLGARLALTVPMVCATAIILLGTALVLLGWVALWRGLRSGPLVTTGVYAATRNPQYLGFILVLAGWVVGWPTVLVVVFAPVLMLVYWRLCRTEERELLALPGHEAYRARVPLLL